MKTNYYDIYGVDVICEPEITIEEARQYVEYLENKYNRKLATLSIDLDGEYVDLNYQF